MPGTAARPWAGTQWQEHCKTLCIRLMKMMISVSMTSLDATETLQKGVQNTCSVCLVCLPLEQGEAAQLWLNQKQEARNLVNQDCQDRALHHILVMQDMRLHLHLTPSHIYYKELLPWQSPHQPLQGHLVPCDPLGPSPTMALLQ